MIIRLLHVGQRRAQIAAVSVTLQVTHSTVLRNACNGRCLEGDATPSRQFVPRAGMTVV